MPNYAYMIAKAVDVVARKLAGMDPENASRVTQALSDEAKVISDELQHSGQRVDQEILAARLEGLVTRMKYEMRNHEPDPSPHEFPIFNVSHNPTAPYPKPINHLYDKQYREAYSTFIKQNSAQGTNKSQSNPEKQSPSSTVTTGQGTSPNVHSQTAVVQPPTQPNPYGKPGYRQPVYYQRQGSHIMPSIDEQSGYDHRQTIQRSSTNDDLRSTSVSRSASMNDLDYSRDSKAEKIRVRVVGNNSSNSGLSDPDTPRREDVVSERARRIYTTPGTEIGDETMQQLFQVANRRRSDSSESSASKPERVIIIDRRGSNSNNNQLGGESKDRYRTFEIRSDNPRDTPSLPSSPLAPLLRSASSAANLYYPGQTGQYMIHPSIGYPRSHFYPSGTNMMYPNAPGYAPQTGGFHPFVYYPY